MYAAGGRRALIFLFFDTVHPSEREREKMPPTYIVQRCNKINDNINQRKTEQQANTEAVVVKLTSRAFVVGLVRRLVGILVGFERRRAAGVYPERQCLDLGVSRRRRRRPMMMLRRLAALIIGDDENMTTTTTTTTTTTAVVMVVHRCGDDDAGSLGGGGGGGGGGDKKKRRQERKKAALHYHDIVAFVVRRRRSSVGGRDASVVIVVVVNQIKI